MKKSQILAIALAGPLLAGPAFAQGSGKDVTILRMSGPQLGVRLEEVDKDVVSRLKLKEEKGALVTEVLENSAALKAGIKKDDVIVRFQGESVLTAAQLSRLVRDVPAGRKVAIDLIRAAAPLSVTATLERAAVSGNKMEMPDLGDLGEQLSDRMEDLRSRLRRENRGGESGGPQVFNFRMDENGPGAMLFNQTNRGRLGITYTEIEGQLARYFKAPKDSAILVNSVVEGSAAEKAGIKAGDLLVKVGSSSVQDASGLQKAVRDLDGGKASPVTVWRDGKNVELSVTVDDVPSSRPRPRRPVA